MSGQPSTPPAADGGASMGGGGAPSLFPLSAVPTFSESFLNALQTVKRELPTTPEDQSGGSTYTARATELSDADSEEPTPDSLREQQQGSLKRRVQSCSDLPRVAARTEKRERAQMPRAALAPMQGFFRGQGPPPPTNRGRAGALGTPGSRGSVGGGGGPNGVSLKAITSCPDMSSLVHGNSAAEDDRRARRLARNRESARLRRLRKKELVDAYERDVARLEGGIRMLRSHEWGRGQEQSLTEALAVERPSPPKAALDGDARQQRRQNLIVHQAEHMQDLLSSLAETESLRLCAAGSTFGAGDGAGSNGAGSGAGNGAGKGAGADAAGGPACGVRNAIGQLGDELGPALGMGAAERHQLLTQLPEFSADLLLEVLVLNKAVRAMQTPGWGGDLPAIKGGLEALEALVSARQVEQLSTAAERGVVGLGGVPLWAMPRRGAAQAPATPPSARSDGGDGDGMDLALSDGCLEV